VAVVLVLAVAAVRLLDSGSAIFYYRVIDDRTLVVGTIEGTHAWTRVTSVTETPSTVTITVSSLRIQLFAGTAVGIPVETVVNLREPLADRIVVDGTSGAVVQPARCPPPTFVAPGCP
jgi:hypothetical protein